MRRPRLGVEPDVQRRACVPQAPVEQRIQQCRQQRGVDHHVGRLQQLFDGHAACVEIISPLRQHIAQRMVPIHGLMPLLDAALRQSRNLLPEHGGMARVLDAGDQRVQACAIDATGALHAANSVQGRA
ncbi:MAG TPA: hypothetical protein VFU71_04540 [Burkholderiaceae bacterium]|nr:hypothetical protein [Burkholderiaceae bacterium]